MARGPRRSGWRPLPPPSGPVLEEVAARFQPPYGMVDTGRTAIVQLRDPTDRLPEVTIRHRYERRLFLRANYLQLSCEVRGAGPAADSELVVRFRGPLGRQRVRLEWRPTVPGGDEWLSQHGDRLRAAATGIQAVERMELAWSAAGRRWKIRVETLSGSMMSGILAALPIAVPFDRSEAASFIALVEILGSSDGSSA